MFSFLSEMWALAAKGELQGIGFWIAVYALLVCGYSCVYQLKVRNWPSTKGLLNKAFLSKFGSTERSTSDQEYLAKAHYSYRVLGQEYEGYRISPWIILASHNLKGILRVQLAGIKPSATGQVDIFYNPKRPSKSFLIPPGKLGLWVTFLLCIGPSVFYYTKYYL